MNNAILERLNIPDRHFDVSMEQIPSKCGHKGHIESFFKSGRFELSISNGYGLYLWGDYSTGKSALLSIVLLRGIVSGLWGLYVTAEDLPKYYIEKTSFDDACLFKDRIENVPILAIDEVLLHHGDTYKDTVIESVFRKRLSKKLSTFFSSNINPDKLKKEYPAFYSAMKESVLPIKVSGYDFREVKKLNLKEEILG